MVYFNFSSVITYTGNSYSFDTVCTTVCLRLYTYVIQFRFHLFLFSPSLCQYDIIVLSSESQFFC